MNVSFLSSTGTFGGLIYNLKKVDMNVADLIYTQNFDGLKHLEEISMMDYMEYLQMWSERNSRVKNAQFHVAISVRGREKSEEELLKISKEWLEGMGYKDTPAMFFFHRDTDNNHIHIISSRVDKDGKKIKDSNEIRRGLALIRELNGVILSEKVKEDFYSLQEYRISSQAQFATLWGSIGYRVKKEGNVVTLHKEGHKVMTMDSASISRLIDKDLLSKERASEIRDFLSRSRDKLSLEDLKILMKERYQIEFVFYGKKESPYGYAVIDHREKKVYKGGDILPLKELLSAQRIFSDQEQINRIHMFVRHMLEGGHMTSKELNSQVKRLGFYINRGEISYRRSQIGLLDADLLDKLRYNDRLEKVSRFFVQDLSTLEALAKYYNVDSRDIIPRSDNTSIEDRNLKEAYWEARGSDDFYSTLSEYGLSMITNEGKYYLLDEKNGYIEEVDTFAIKEEYSQGEEKSLQYDTLDVGDTINSLLSLDVFEDVATSSVDNSLRKRRRGK